MPRYIDADELIFIGLDNPDDDHLFEFVPKEFIDNAPTADVAPVVHGKWIFSADDAEGLCSVCHYKLYGKPYQGKYLIVPYNYCPNCGARMDGEHGKKN